MTRSNSGSGLFRQSRAAPWRPLAKAPASRRTPRKRIIQMFAMTTQFNFFHEPEREAAVLEGFRYQSEFISARDEEALLSRVRELPFRPFEFHGYLGKRRTVSFGWQYEFSGGGKLQKAGDIPDFLLPLRSLAASFAALEPEDF